jgi:two-component system NtrC family sensor kinase
MFNFFSIRAKFLSVMSALLMACLVIYLLIAVHVFKTDKTELIFDLNRSMVSNLSAEIETEFIGISDKFKVFALASNSKNLEMTLTETLFNERSSVVYVSLYRQNQSTALKTHINKKFIETYGLKETFFDDELIAHRPVPVNEIIKHSEFIWNASIENGVPLIGYGRSVVIENENGIPTDHLAVVGYMQPVKALKALSAVSLSQLQITDANGNILLHPDFKVLSANKNVNNLALFKAAQNSKVNVSVATVKENDTESLAAFAKSYQGKIFVLAEASKDKAFQVVYDLVSRSVSFALIAITLSLLFAFLFSRSLTRPISILVDGMHKVSEGDLSTQIDVKSNDETKILASSFNQMINELRQSRDELETINRELDKKVKERTLQLEIQNKAVKEAQEALLKTTRLASAGEIAGRAAHEVLNPLTGMLTRLSSMEKRVQSHVQPQINLMKDIFVNWNSDHQEGGFAKLVEVWQQPSQIDTKWNIWAEDMQNLNEVQINFGKLLKSIEDDTQFLIEESRRIGKIINSMRKLSRLNSDVHTYSMRSLLTDCKNIMADLFQQNNIRLIESFDMALDEVDIDRDEFIQISTNLLRNSLQAMNPNDKNSVNYFMKISSHIQDSHIYIDFTDNGSGVAKEHENLLFDNNFSTKSADEGTGLGLSISRRLIRAHGGDLEFISSKSFEETIFRLKIPLKNKNQLDVKVGAS